MLANRRRELTEEKNKLEQQVTALREKVAEIDLELGAIDAYDAHMARRTHAPDIQVAVRSGRGKVTQEDVLAVIRAEVNGKGVSRGDIINGLDVKGNRSGEIAVDNRLRELKRKNSVRHEGRLYRAVP